MKIAEKFDKDIFNYYYSSVAETELSGNYIDPFNSQNIIKPLYEYDFLEKQIRFDSNQKIAGYKAIDLKSLDDFYNLVNPYSVDHHLKYSAKAFDIIGRKDHATNKLLLMKVVSYMTLKGKNGNKFIYKRISIDNGRKRGYITCNANFFIDITNCIPKYESMASLNLNGSDKYNLEIDELNKFKQLLTPREVEIMELITRGFTSADIAQGLGISIHTVKTQRKNMIRKLDVSNSAEMVNLARDMGLF